MKRSIMSLALVIAVGLGSLIGAWIAAPPPEPVVPEPTAAGDPATTEAASAPSDWTCSMHPQVHSAEPGACPICGMDLIPSGSSGSAGSVVLSEDARTLAGIETVTAERRLVHKQLRMIGRVAYDETRVTRVTAWYAGRIERMFLDFAGSPVRRGDHLLQMYSPELMVAQQDMIQAHKAVARLPAGGSATLSDSTRQRAATSREKLRLQGLQKWQIDYILKVGKPQERITLFTPSSGVVTEKAAVEGAWVAKGSPLYTIADLSRLWVELDAFETDIEWLLYGQLVSFEAKAWPGESFSGTVSFVDPVLNPRTRTVRVRVAVDNTGLRLKPGMFVRANVRVAVGGAGSASAKDLAGTWICPMHPEVVSDEAGKCSECSMKLVAAEDHWLVGPALAGAAADAPLPLVIPATAPLITGRRAVVFVQMQGAADPTYLLREVVLGPRAGDSYVVASGLMAGERIVARGAFKLDSALQLRGDRSAMGIMREGGDPHAGHAHAANDQAAHDDAAGIPEVPLPETVSDAFLAALGQVVAASRPVSAGLSADDPAAAKAAAPALAAAAHFLSEQGELSSAMVEATDALAAGAPELPSQRRAFGDFNAALMPLILRYGAGSDAGDTQLVECPMAFDNAGATWLQAPGDVANPYFGAQMLQCGDIRELASP